MGFCSLFTVHVPFLSDNDDQTIKGGKCCVGDSKGTSPKCPQKGARPATGAPKSKRAKSAKTVTPHGVEDDVNAQLSHVTHIPMVSEGSLFKDLATIVSGAVLKGLKTAGLISNHPQPTR